MDDPSTRPSSPLFRLIVGSAALLAVVDAGLIRFWGSGPIVAEVPWFVPVMHSLIGFIAFSAAFLALGRYQVLRDPGSFWVGLAFAAFCLGNLFYVLAWPGLMPNNRAVIARLPSTSAWIV